MRIFIISTLRGYAQPFQGKILKVRNQKGTKIMNEKRKLLREKIEKEKTEQFKNKTDSIFTIVLAIGLTIIFMIMIPTLFEQSEDYNKALELQEKAIELQQEQNEILRHFVLDIK